LLFGLRKQSAILGAVLLDPSEFLDLSGANLAPVNGAKAAFFPKDEIMIHAALYDAANKAARGEFGQFPRIVLFHLEGIFQFFSEDTFDAHDISLRLLYRAKEKVSCIVTSVKQLLYNMPNLTKCIVTPADD